MIRILHVDDDFNDLELFQLNIKRITDELDLQYTNSAKDALEKPDLKDYDCIISDYQMPELNGIEFLKTLRAKEIETPFILLTGQGNEEVAVEAMRQEGTDYFQKNAGFLHYQKLVHTVKKSIQAYKERIERRKVEGELLDNRKMLEKFFNTLNDVVILLDYDLKVLQCNDVAMDLFGKTREGIYQFKLPEFTEGLFGGKVVEMLKRVSSTRRVESQEIEGWRKGEPVWFSIKAMPMKHGLSVIASDISERIKSKHLLEISEKKYRTIFQRSADALFLMHDSNYVEVNRSTLELFGCEEEDIIGKTPFDFSPDKQNDGQSSEEKARRLIAACLDGEVQKFDWVHLKLDGTPFLAEVTLDSIDIEGAQILLARVREK